MAEPDISLASSSYLVFHRDISLDKVLACFVSFWRPFLGRPDTMIDLPCVLIQRDPGVESMVRVPRVSVGNISQLALGQSRGADSIPERGEF